MKAQHNILIDYQDLKLYQATKFWTGPKGFEGEISILAQVIGFVFYTIENTIEQVMSVKH